MTGREALTAKCRTMKGRLLSKDQYLALAARQSLPDAVAFLASTEGYSKIFADVDPNRVHRARLEQLLERNIIDAYSKLYTFTSGSEREFFGLLIEEFTITCLLDAIRATEYDDSMDFYPVPNFIREHSAIDFSRIFRTDSRDEILAALSGTEYHETLEGMIDGSFEDIESALLRAYYKKLVKKTGKLFSGVEQKEILGAIHAKIDIINISIILRTRRFRALDEGRDNVRLEVTEVFPRLIPIFGKFRESDIKDLCTADLTVDQTMAGYLTRMRRSPDELDEKTSTGEYGTRLIYANSKKLSRGSTLACALGFLTLLRVECDNLIYILEAIRYGIPAERIVPKIIV